MAKKFDPVKAKAKKDKILAGVLGGILLVVAIFSVPMTLRYWKKVNGGGNQAAQTAPAPTPTTPAPVAPVATVPSGGLGDTVSAPLSTSQLHAFDLFQSKDPFEQQVDVDAPVVSASPPPPPPSASPPSARPFVPGPATTPAAAQPPTGAVVSVNGAPAELLGVGADFPLPPATPLFHLHSMAKGRIKISIVGGSYADGSPTVTLRVGRPLTLENTADGTRYELRLLWVGAGAPPAGLVPTPPTGTPSATPSTPSSTP